MTNDNSGLRAATELTLYAPDTEALRLSALRDQLAIHAPPCPMWFLSKELGDDAWNEEHGIKCTALWPWHYADLVINARSNQSNL